MGRKPQTLGFIFNTFFCILFFFLTLTKKNKQEELRIILEYHVFCSIFGELRLIHVWIYLCMYWHGITNGMWRNLVSFQNPNRRNRSFYFKDYFPCVLLFPHTRAWQALVCAWYVTSSHESNVVRLAGSQCHVAYIVFGYLFLVGVLGWYSGSKKSYSMC